MASRKLRYEGDPILNKISKPVERMTLRQKILIQDMFDTMYEDMGVGLAAVQVGVLRRIVVMNVDGEHPLVFINPEIIERDGEQTGDEGCLSVPGKVGTVTRPMHVKVRAQDINMQPFELDAEGLLARCCCHEFEHLDGILYTSHVEGELRDVNAEPEIRVEEDEEFQDN